MNVSQNETKKKIRDTALKLFSEKGYEGVSVADIAAGVGIKAPSLYKHYKSKNEIFSSIIENAESRFMEFIGTIRIDDKPVIGKLTPEILEEKMSSYVRYALHDEEYSRLRRFLTIEQYGSAEAAKLYDRIYVSYLFSYHTALFKKLINEGVMGGEDPEIMAMMYGSPIIVMIGMCDRNPEVEGEIIEKLKRHVRAFYEIYQIRK